MVMFNTMYDDEPHQMRVNRIDNGHPPPLLSPSTGEAEFYHPFTHLHGCIGHCTAFTIGLLRATSTFFKYNSLVTGLISFLKVKLGILDQHRL